MPRRDSNRGPCEPLILWRFHQTNRINPTKFIIFVCSTGHHEFHFLKSLQSHYSSICNVAVDPNEGMLQTFNGRVATLNFGDKSSCHWFPGPLSQFVAESPLAGNKFNLISSIHSLYYTGDFETTFTQLASMMKDKGLMIIVCQNGRKRIDIIICSIGSCKFLN